MLIYSDTIEFNFEGKEHLYTVRHKIGNSWTNWQEVEGVTTILKIINKPALMRYPMNKALEYLRETLKSGMTMPEMNTAIGVASKAHIEHSNMGKKHGTIGHALVEALVKGQKIVMPTDPELLKAAESVKQAFLSFMNDHAPEMLGAEEAIYSKEYNYGGKLDQRIRLDKHILLDWKTSNKSYFNPDGIYPDNFAQGGAYALAWEEMGGEPIEDIGIVNLSKDGTGYVFKRLSDMGLTVTEAKLYFINALMLHRSHHKFEYKVKGG